MPVTYRKPNARAALPISAAVAAIAPGSSPNNALTSTTGSLPGSIPLFQLHESADSVGEGRGGDAQARFLHPPKEISQSINSRACARSGAAATYSASEP